MLNTRYHFLTLKQQKELFRIGVPDSVKRGVLLEMFNININTCEFDYNAIKNAVDDDFHKFT